MIVLPHDTSTADATRRARPWLPPLILAILPLWMAFRYTTPVPRADHWGMVVAPYFKIRNGAPFWETIHTHFNDSWMDLCILIHQLLIRFTGWNLWMESALCGLLGVVTAWLLLREMRAFPRGDSWARLMPWVAAWWLLSPRQWMNWSWGVQICYALVVLMTMVTVVALRSRKSGWQRLLLGMAAATAACLSFVNGWLAWILGAGILFWNWRNAGWKCRNQIAAFAIWIAAAAALAWGLFGVETVSIRNPGASLFDRVVEDPRPTVRYFFHVLGAPFSDMLLTWDRGDTRLQINETAAASIAIISLLSGAVLLYRGLRGDWKKHSSAVTLCGLLAVWGIANAAAIALARTGVALSNPFESRYPAFTIWWHIALLGLWSLVKPPWLRRLRWAWLAVLMWGSISGAIMGLRDVRHDYDRNRHMCVAAAFRHVAPDPPYLQALSSLPPAATVAALDILEQARLLAVNTIRDPSPAAAPLWRSGAEGKLESADVISGALYLRGWAIRSRDRDSVDGIVISIQPDGEPERWFGVAQRRQIRAKIARKTNSTAQNYRVGWDYIHGYNPGVPLPPGAGPLPLPAGPVTFRAYAVDLRSGSVARLEGEEKLNLPIE